MRWGPIPSRIAGIDGAGRGNLTGVSSPSGQLQGQRHGNPRSSPTIAIWRVFSYRILFVRHGETAWNTENRLQGQHDIPLNPRGREQASAVGRMLRASIPHELEKLDRAGAFVASPLSRARETMERLRAAMAFAPEIYRLDPVLMELTFGDWEGHTWSEVAARKLERRARSFRRQMELRPSERGELCDAR